MLSTRLRPAERKAVPVFALIIALLCLLGAIACGGGGGSSQTVTPTVPAAPSTLSAVAGDTNVSLSWTASSDANSYSLYRATSAGGEGSTALKTGIATTSYTDSGLTNGTTYYYKVAAVNSVGTSALSTEASATPTAPAHSSGLINGVSTDSARYAPGSTATITINLNNASGSLATGEVQVAITHLGSLVSTLPLQAFSLNNGDTSQLTFSWTTPTQDFQGYSVEVTALDSSGSTLSSMNSAIDVSSTWTKFPRYGYVASYPSQSSETSTSHIAALNKFHINGVQFYDWQWKHHVPLAGTVSSPADSWVQLNNQTNYRQTVLDYINAAHGYGMSAMNYNLVYGAWADYRTDGSGVLPDWGLYLANNATSQYNISFTSIPWATPYIYLFNPGNPNWQSYLIGQEAKVFQAYPFDGWHADQIGPPGTVYNYTGQSVTPSSEYASLLGAAKSTLNKTIAFNTVGGYGLPDVLSSEDFAYVECWPSLGQTTYNDLKALVDSVTASKPGIGVVLPAYMDYTYAQSKTGRFNAAGILLTDAVIFASGASHLELGGGAHGLNGVQMLDNEYFPNTNLTPTAPLLQTLQNYYDFDVEYQNLLRGGLANNNNVVELTGVRSSSTALANSVWAFSKNDSSGHMISFINMIGEPSINWRDDNANYPVPTLQSNVPVKYYYGSGAVSAVYWATPDSGNGRMTTLPFTSGADSRGSYAAFTLPSLAYWDMAYISISQ